jgi:Protein of unknown function (DUF3179)
MSPSFNRIIVIFLFLFLIFSEILRVWFVMPFPGSQGGHTIDFAYWINTNIWWIRLVTGAGIIIAIARVFTNGQRWEKICLPIALAICATVFLLFNYRLSAEAIFRQPSSKSFISVNDMEDKSKLVIGVTINGESKAYPIQFIGYHHQVADTVGDEPLMVTYCTVCRTGRVFSTIVNGRHESFRLVGMDQYNAVFEDATTKSWWQQATGEAIAGPLKGTMLKEIPSVQLTAEVFMRKYPDATVMAPDPLFDERYFKLEDYDRGTMHSPLVKRDYRSWQRKSWIVGIKNESSSNAYDWNDLVKKRLIQDSLQSLPVLVAVENDTTTYHVFDRRLKGFVLEFDTCVRGNGFTDLRTKSTWNMDGQCIAGPLKGQQLSSVQAYHEFWHAWQTFQPNVRKYVSN